MAANGRKMLQMVAKFFKMVANDCKVRLQEQTLREKTAERRVETGKDSKSCEKEDLETPWFSCSFSTVIGNWWIGHRRIATINIKAHRK